MTNENFRQFLKDYLHNLDILVRAGVESDGEHLRCNNKPEVLDPVLKGRAILAILRIW